MAGSDVTVSTFQKSLDGFDKRRAWSFGARQTSGSYDDTVFLSMRKGGRFDLNSTIYKYGF
jgi:hypothetical protein